MGLLKRIAQRLSREENFPKEPSGNQILKYGGKMEIVNQLIARAVEDLSQRSHELERTLLDYVQDVVISDWDSFDKVFPDMEIGEEDTHLETRAQDALEAYLVTAIKGKMKNLRK